MIGPLWVIKSFRKNVSKTFLNVQKNLEKFVLCQVFFLCFLFNLSFCHINIKKIFSKFHMAISCPNMGDKGDNCIPSGAQTHIIAHTKGEPRARLSNPFLCQKIILKTIKSFSISDQDKDHLFSNKLLHQMRLNIVLQIFKLLLNIFLFKMETLTGR